jgi:FAD/FMN-containing dehydrogenase
MPHAPSAAALAELKETLSPAGILTDSNDIAPYLTDHRRIFTGRTPLVAQPATTTEVAAVMQICHREAIAVVPHGGNTSYCGAATPDESGTQLVLSLRRMNRVRAQDTVNQSLIAEAGCTLASVQAAAVAVDRLFPLSLGSEGSAQIGGCLSTNAGGTAVLRYGMMRDLVFGLEVVLADGRTLSSLRALRKDNTGYDLKSLFIGAEGTLGVITAANLKLFPAIRDSGTALVAVASPRAALEFLTRIRAAAGDLLTSFELMPRNAIELTTRLIDGVANPLSLGGAWYVLAELSSPNADAKLTALLTDQLAAAAAAEIVHDAHVATSFAQATAMWKLRESIPEAQRRHGPSLKHDVSVPISALDTLIEQGTALARRIAPEGEVLAYGHAGDGNLHFNVNLLPGANAAAFAACAPALEQAMFDLVESLGGSISAEHGIGRLKAREFARRADPVELALMQEIKRALDPKGIMNPGKVLL